LGFSKVSIVTAFVVESTFLAIVGGALGCVIALPADGMTSAAMGASFAEIGFAFRTSGTSLVGGNGARGPHGCRGRRVACGARGTDADHVGAERRLKHKRRREAPLKLLLVLFSFQGNEARWRTQRFAVLVADSPHKRP